MFRILFVISGSATGASVGDLSSRLANAKAEFDSTYSEFEAQGLIVTPGLVVRETASDAHKLSFYEQQTRYLQYRLGEESKDPQTLRKASEAEYHSELAVTNGLVLRAIEEGLGAGVNTQYRSGLNEAQLGRICDELENFRSKLIERMKKHVSKTDH